VNFSKKRVLVVDAELEIRQFLITRLTLCGYEVFAESNGKDALLSFAKYEPDLIILDTLLPKLDGYEVCRIIRDTSQVPIIILTALAKTSNLIMSLDSGADDYLIKPFSQRELEARINSILRRSKLEISQTSRKGFN
jgi:DNA-binding response OmpR family regulator